MENIIIQPKNESEFHFLMELLKKLDVKITKTHKTEIIDKKPNKETLKAIQDAEHGKVNQYKNSQELFDNLGI